MRIVITGPTDPSILVLTWCVTVTCEHGETSRVWRRVCRNGCHRRGPARASACPTVTPTDDLIRDAGVLDHGARLACGCDERYWMEHGPGHSEVEGPAWSIQVDERPLRGVEYEEMRASVQGTLHLHDDGAGGADDHP